MSRYIDLVICTREGRKVMAEAPSFTRLQQGDQVRLIGQRELWTVVMSISIDQRSDDYQFWRKAFEANEKVAARVLYENMKWEEYEDE